MIIDAIFCKRNQYCVSIFIFHLSNSVGSNKTIFDRPSVRIELPENITQIFEATGILVKVSFSNSFQETIL